MKELIINLGTNTNEIELVPLGDLHIGDPHCNIELIKDTIDYIKNTKDKINQLQKNINNENLPEVLKRTIEKDCNEIKNELTDMRILLIQPEIKSMDEWDDHKQNIAILQSRITDNIKQAIMANHAPTAVNIK